MSQPAAQIYTGLWINWSHGAVLGSTLTLSASHGGLLTAFLAIFVSVAGAACWTITSFALHQYRAKLEYQDGLHHQQQLILRGNFSPISAFSQFSQLIYHWQSLAKNPIRRTLPLAIPALLNLILFALASVFSSQVAKAPGNEALISPGNCGDISWSDDLSFTLSRSIYASKVLNDSANAAAYARACYSTSQKPLLCNQYAKQQIPWKVNRNSSCPFGESMCLLGPSAALELDTGLISSHDVLGINAPPKHRINYRKVTTCSPITTKNHFRVWNDTDPAHLAYGDKYIRYELGEQNSDTNYTYSYNTHIQAENMGYVLKYVIPNPCGLVYMKLLTGKSSYLKATGTAGSDTGWQPIAPLDRKDADVTLFLLASNSIIYSTPVSDPFYSANIKRVMAFNTSQGTENLSIYSPDFYVNALACIDRNQFCNPTNGKCTPLSSWNLTEVATENLGLNAKQKAIVYRLEIMFYCMFLSVSGRGSSALRASDSLFELAQYSLPNDQWMIEVSSWFALAMAKLQQRIVQYATGPPYMPDGAILRGPRNAAEMAMCESQRVRSPSGTMSFSVLGVAIILIVGSMLMGTSLCLEKLVGFLRRKFAIKEYKRLQWILDSIFQLHRLAYEQAGQGTWAGGTDLIPTTKRGDLLGIPYLQDEESHPRLRNDYRPESTLGQKTPLFSVEAV